MIKKIILFLSFLFLAGCNVKYNLVYENNVFEEKLNVNIDKNNNNELEENFEVINNYYNNVDLIVDYKAEPGNISRSELLLNYETYNKTIIDEVNFYGISLGYLYDKSEKINNSVVIHSLFSQIYVSNKSIFVSDIKNIFNNYSNLNSIEISFKTDKKILNTNCDREENNVYYWTITKDNYIDKKIKINFFDEVNKSNEENLNTRWKYAYVIIGFLGIIILIYIIYFYNRIKSLNK